VPDVGALWVALLVLVLLYGYERAFAMVFVLNFSTEGPNATVGLVLLLLSGLLYVVGLQRWWPHPVRLLDVSVVTGLLLAGLSLVQAPAWAALGALSMHLVLAPAVFATVAAYPVRGAAGAALGVLLHQVGRNALNTAPFYDAQVGTYLLVAVIAFLAILWFGRVRFEAGAPGLPAPTFTRVGAFYAFLVAQYAFLGSSAAVSLWNGRPYVPAVLGLTGGLALGAVWVARGWPLTPRVAWSAAALFAVGLLDLLLWNQLPPILLIAQAAAVVLLHVAWRSGGRASLAGQAATLLLLVSLLLPVIALRAVRRGFAS
jgi:hypothetical protein